MGAILIFVGAILYWGDFEVGAILIDVGAILTGVMLQWGDLTCIPMSGMTILFQFLTWNIVN